MHKLHSVITSSCRERRIRERLKCLEGTSSCSGRIHLPDFTGRFFACFFALRDWVQFVDRPSEAAMSFCDAIYYHFEGGEIVPTSEFAH